MRTCISTIFLIFSVSTLSGQGIQYQAVARDAAGQILASQNLRLILSIFPKDSSFVLYEEEHQTATDAFGQFTLVLGQGAPMAGSMASVDWGKGPLELGIELDAGQGFRDMGRTPLQGVPFSFFAQRAASADMALGALNDVQALSPGNGQVLKYDTASRLWAPGNDLQGLSSVNTSSRLRGDGTPGNPLDLAGQNAQNGQVLKWNGSAWVPAADQTGPVYNAGTGISIAGNIILNTGDTNASDDITIASMAGGDISGPFSNLQIRPGVVGSGEIADNSIQAEDIAGGVLPASLPPNGPAGGDLAGNYPNPIVARLQGRAISNVAPGNGQVLAWNGSSWSPATPEAGNSIWALNNTNAFYNSGRVGIGLNTPQNLLHIHNSEIFSGSPSNIQLTNSNTGTTASDGLHMTLNSTISDYGLIGGLLLRENGSLAFGANNSYDLFLRPSGAMGLGTFNPQGKMEIFYNSGDHASPQLMIAENEASFGRISFRSAGVSNKYWTLAARTQGADANSQFNLFYHNGSSGQNLFTATGSGLIGIGTSAPTRMLHLHFSNNNLSTGQMLLTQAGGGDSWMNIGIAGGAHYAVGVDQSDGQKLKIGYDAAAPNGVHVNTRLTIDGSGNVGIGTASPQQALDVSGSIRTSGEINRAATGNANLVPVAYGTVDSDGKISSGSGNFSAVRSSTGNYQITIAGENFFFESYSVSVTITGGDPALAMFSSVSGKLLIRTYDISAIGAMAQNRGFSFVVFKP